MADEVKIWEYPVLDFKKGEKIRWAIYHSIYMPVSSFSTVSGNIRRPSHDMFR